MIFGQSGNRNVRGRRIPDSARQGRDEGIASAASFVGQGRRPPFSASLKSRGRAAPTTVKPRPEKLLR